MPPLKKKNVNKFKDERTPQEIAVHSALTSHYNIFTPMYKAHYIRIKNPTTTKDYLFKVDEPAFFEMFYELSKLGLKDKMMQEIETFTATIDPDWQDVYASLEEYIKIKESSNG